MSGERLAFKNPLRQTDWVAQADGCLPSISSSLPFSLQSGSCYSTQSIPRFLESSDGHHDNHDGTLEASSVVTSPFLSFHFLSLPQAHTHTHLCAHAYSQTHTHIQQINYHPSACQNTITDKYTHTRTSAHSRIRDKLKLASDTKITVNTLHLY